MAADFYDARDMMLDALRRRRATAAIDAARIIDDLFDEHFSEGGRLDELAGYIEAIVLHARR